MIALRPLVRTRLAMTVFLSMLAGLLAFGTILSPSSSAFHLPTAGSLDNTFSADGRQTDDVKNVDVGKGTALLPDGRIVVVGTSVSGTAYDMEVAIFKTDGSPERKAAFDLGAEDFAESVAIVKEAEAYRLIVAGCTGPIGFDYGVQGDVTDNNCGSGGQFAAIKVNPDDLVRDMTFGGSGIATTTTLNEAHGHDVVVQTDGKFIIAGGTNSVGTGQDFALARFNSDGTPDFSWGVAGIVITDNPLAHRDEEAWGVTLQTDSTGAAKVVAAGQTDNSLTLGTSNFDVAVTRYTSFGLPDPTWSDDGWTTSDVDAAANSADFGRDVQVQPTPDGTPPGKVVVGGFTRFGGAGQFLAIRYTDGGAEEADFGDGGMRLIDVGTQSSGGGSEAWSLSVADNRKIVLGGFSKASGTAAPDFAVVRLGAQGTDDGDPDFSFGSGGIQITDFGGTADKIFDTVIQPDGRIVAAGISGADLGVARYIGDPIASLSAPVPTTEGVTGTVKLFTFTISLSTASTETSVFTFQTSNGTTDGAEGCSESAPTNSCDYFSTSTVVTVPRDSLVGTVSVKVRGDDVGEPNETFIGTISAASGPAAVNPERGSATATILNDDAGKIEISDAPPISEGAAGTTSTVSFRVTHEPANPPGVTTTIRYQTANGTATVTDSDYVPNSGSLIFGPGERSKDVTASVVGDANVEQNETFYMDISDPTVVNESGNPDTPPPAITRSRGTATILDDDDPRPKLSIDDVTREEGTAFGGKTPFVFTVTVRGDVTQTVTARYGTDDCPPDPGCPPGVATVGLDYDSNHGTVVFTPGFGTTRTVTVTVNADDLPELHEVFKVTLTSTSAQVEDGEGRGTIRDDDGGEGALPPEQPVDQTTAGGPGTVSWGPNRLDVFVRGSDNGIWHKWWDGSSWQGYESMGGFTNAAPEVASWQTGRLDLFVRGSDNALWHKFYDGTSWSGWDSLGGVLTSDPAVVSWGPGRIDVFVRGTDNALWQKTYNGSWGGWNSLGGVLVSGSDAASWGPGRLDVFVKGTDGALWHQFFNGAWSGWSSQGGFLQGDPSAVSWDTGRIDVFVRGSDDGIWHKFYAGSWSGYDSLGGFTNASPDSSSWAPGRLDLFVRGSDGALWHKFFAGTWSGYDSLGGFIHE